jgi:uncharacterized integral membrane protein (TIGR00698 family)
MMGFGMSLTQVLEASKEGLIDTAFSVVLVMGTGYLLTRLLKVDSKTGILISSGTAICGGSAIAAISPVINAKHGQISFSLLVIFVLNAIALLIFPGLGHYFNLSQTEFGQWAAIAIHDTSSVVGAGAAFGKEALEVATTVKLVRTLWIIPLALVLSLLNKNHQSSKLKLPWFILFFVLAVLLAYVLPQYADLFQKISGLGRKIMTFSLFLIGSSISFQEVKKVGFKSFVLGIGLWIIIGVSSLLMLTLLK